MARKPRIHFAGALYHVMSCGNQGQSIFKDERDRKCYLDFLKEGQKRFGYRLYAYVLMGNHAHHLIQIGQTPLSKVMQNILFRTRDTGTGGTKRRGILFQGRYRAIMCDKESYLLELKKLQQEAAVLSKGLGKLAEELARKPELRGVVKRFAIA
ncbi:MAG: transposase [Deltaproteobacteria bacterium]|nr:transposase [Deltaproteobacteria bacterium]MBI2368390.1 transposase [Deltaproteobacteria bacterium]MBI2531526.1 transposase [Deltaproteobacteria bacterium]